MPARAGRTSQEGYPSSSPSLDAHSNDPFNTSQGRRYYDNESDHVDFLGRRDYRETYTSDASNLAGNDYDHNGNYEYRATTISLIFILVLCLIFILPYFLLALQDTDSDPDVYVQRPAPSSESLGPPPGRVGYPDSSTPTFMEYGGPAGAREAYPAWNAERQIPLSKEEIEDIFLDLTQKFGFQRDSMRNMVRSLFFDPPSLLVILPCPFNLLYFLSNTILDFYILPTPLLVVCFVNHANKKRSLIFLCSFSTAEHLECHHTKP